MNNNRINPIFNESAKLVKNIGEVNIYKEISVKKYLTVDGISYWDVISSILAINYFPKALSSNYKEKKLITTHDLLKRNINFIYFYIKLKLNKSRNISNKPINNSSYILLGFTKYMYRDVLEPIAKSLEKSNSIIVVTDKKFKNESNIKYLSILDFTNRDVKKEFKVIRKKIKIAIKYLLNSKDIREYIEHNNIKWQIFYNIILNVYKNVFPKLILEAIVSKSIIKKFNPALIISPDVNDPRTRLFCLAARLFGIKTLEIQFAIFNENDVEWRFFIADYLAIHGEAYTKIMKYHGIQNCKMEITGSPRYDNVKKRDIKSSNYLNIIPKDRIIVLFASGPNDFGAVFEASKRNEMINALFRAFESNDQMSLIVKPHPLEKVKELKMKTNKESNIIFADKESDIRDLLRISDVFITFFSTTTFDALVADKPTIILNFANELDNNIFVNSQIVNVAKNENDINSILLKIQNGKIFEENEKWSYERKKFIEYWLYKVDGCSTDRIISIAKKLSKNVCIEKEKLKYLN
jgi:hypothetical protein